jgi:hypothetical protein
MDQTRKKDACMVLATLVRTGRLYSLTGSGRTLLNNRSHTQTVTLLPERRSLLVEVSSEEIQNQILGSQQIECAGTL